jgi:1-acyl-sn-glycerol-3-phosphate acyltransferase
MQSKREHTRDKRTFWYSVARVLGRVLCTFIYPVCYHDRQRIDSSAAPYIVMANHISMLDPIFIALVIKRYEVCFLGKRELGANALLKFFLDKLHTIFVSRHMTDMAAMRACNEVLKQNKVLGLFPEGTRVPPEKLMQNVESGLSLIALRNRVPVMPVYIHGRVRPFCVTHVYFLPALDYKHLVTRGVGKDVCDELTRLLVSTLMQARQNAQQALSPR